MTTFSSREVALILYKAAELQERTWWLRTVRFMTKPDLSAACPCALDDVLSIGEQMGLSVSNIRKAVGSLSDGVENWTAT